MKQANPLIWGAVAAIIGGGMVVLGQLTGEPPLDDALLQNPFSAAVMSFFWGCAAGYAKNWYGNRINRR